MNFVKSSVRTVAWATAGALAIVLLMWFASAPRAAGAACHGQVGIASFYGPESGHVTANGERFRPDGLTAASRTLPFGTVLIVRNVQNGRFVRVRVNDRGPYVRGRFLDLSRGAARAIGLSLGRVCVERVG